MPSYSCSLPPRTCEKLSEACIVVAETKARVSNLEKWQTNQNGKLERIDGRLDNFLWWFVGILTTSAGTFLLILLRQAGIIGS